MKNAVLHEAWCALRAQIIDHCMRIFTETGALETIVAVDVREVDGRTACMSATLSDGTIVSAEYDIWSAALAQGFQLSEADCFGSAVRPM